MTVQGPVHSDEILARVQHIIKNAHKSGQIKTLTQVPLGNDYWVRDDDGWRFGLYWAETPVLVFLNHDLDTVVAESWGTPEEIEAGLVHLRAFMVLDDLANV